MAKILVIAPHPDDETLGCGGTILRHRSQGDEVHCLLVTGMHVAQGFSEERMREREAEIAKVAEAYGFESLTALACRTTQLDAMPLAELVSAIGGVLQRVAPDTVYLPFHGDAHSDHRRVAEGAMAACKWFRAPYVRQILAYETLSETNFALPGAAFQPTVYHDIEPFLEEKLRVMSIYRSELGIPPFPRSVEALNAMALLRGSEAGFSAAEAFVLIRLHR